MRRATTLALLTLLVGCDADARLLAVQVRTDYLPGTEFASIVTLVQAGETTRDARFDDLDAPFARGIRVADFELPSGQADLRVELRDAAGAVLVARPVIVDLDRDQAATVVLSRRCESVVCSGPDEACELGRCVSIRCVEERPEACDRPECADDVECADGSACAAGECTASGGCFYGPDDARCGADERCHPTRGCELADPTRDAGVSDAGAGAGDAGFCAETPCRLVAPQCGCPAGQGCGTSGGMRVCSPAGALDDGAECTGPGQCAPGLLCLIRGARAAGTCAPYCEGNGDCPLATRPCGSLAGTMVGACSHACDPIGQTGCPGALGCLTTLTNAVPIDGTAIITAQCGDAIGAPTGSMCAASAECSPGDLCTAMGCLRMCDLDNAVCGAGETCTDLMGLTLPDGRRLGACV